MRQLKKERDRVERQLTGLNAALAAFAGVYTGNEAAKPGRILSAKGRARIAAAQKVRWAKAKGRAGNAKRGKRKLSASGRRKIAAAQRARWAKVRREKKTA
jgi:poly-gamma-glutamate capsule biosynthesis protein CapA/YwtB (metallophosphatase superfamily)